MSNETEASTQTLDCSSDRINLKLRQKQEMDSQEIELSGNKLRLRLLDERVKQATDPILRRVEELCVLLADRSESESTRNSEGSGSRRDNASTSPHVTGMTVVTVKKNPF